MKKRYLVILGLAFAFCGCQDEVLNKDVLGLEKADLFFSKKENAESAVVGAYDPMQRINGFQRVWYALGDCRAGIARVAGSGTGDQPDAQRIMNFAAISGDLFVTERYRWLYTGVQRTNTCIENLSLPDITYDKDALLGQAYFLRAFYYFELVTTYGPVPLYTTNLLPSDSPKNRSEDPAEDAAGHKQIEAIYKQITSDFAKAATLLKAKSVWDKNNLGRATCGAARAMLAKVYVFMASDNTIFTGSDKSQYWKLAASYADSVINSGVYKLTVPYHNNFGLFGLHENNDESIFEVQFTKGGDYDFKADGSIMSVDQTARFFMDRKSKVKTGYCYGLNSPTSRFVALYDVVNKDGSLGYKFDVNGTDLKKDWDPRLDLIAKPEDSIFRPLDLKAGNPMWFGFGYDGWKFEVNEPFYSRKMELPYSVDLGANQQSAGLNYTYLRYADLLLYRAEIALALGDVSAALKYVNQVRERARNSKIAVSVVNAQVQVTPTSGTLPADLSSVDVKTILDERARELGLEYHHFYDMVRLGVAATELNYVIKDENGEYTRTFKKGRDEFLPIPVVVITEGQGNIVQNPGY